MWHRRRFFLKFFYSSCAFFVFGALIYDHYPSYSNLYDQLTNENISIEEALQDLSICTSDDRSRQRSLLHILQSWTHFAYINHIQYWIAYGTLLGYVHRQTLLPHDSNIDIFIMAHDTSKLFELSQLNFSIIYKLKVHPQWYITEQRKRSYFYSDDIDFIAPNARFVNIKNNLYLNIWPIYDYHPNESRIDVSRKAMLTAYDTNYNWKSSPKEWTFPLQECQFGGIDVWCPAQPKKLIADLYGEISLNKSSTICFNGSWIKSDEDKSINKKDESSSTEESTELDTTSSTSTKKSTSASTNTKKSTSASTSTKKSTSASTSTKKITSESTTTSTKESTSESTSTTTSESPSTTLSDDDLIEKALETIPKCTARDRPHQKILLRLLQAWSQLTEKHNLEYSLAYGSLVGYVQRGGLLPHDGDIDVIMLTDDVPKLINISQTNFSSEFEIKVQPQWYIVGDDKRSYVRDQGINFVAPNARFIYRKTGDHVDIFPAYDYNSIYLNKTIEEDSTQQKNITMYGITYDLLQYPRTWVYPLETCYFSEIKAVCPANPKELVSAIYGVSSLTKSDTKCVNGSWVNA